MGVTGTTWYTNFVKTVRTSDSDHDSFELCGVSSKSSSGGTEFMGILIGII